VKILKHVKISGDKSLRALCWKASLGPLALDASWLALVLTWLSQ